MEIYILDSLLRRQNVIDRYSSCIWTERFSAYGDFELVLPSTVDNRRLFQKNTMLACNLSNYVMIVQTVLDERDAEGRRMLTVKGTSLEMVLADRVAFGVIDDLTTVPKWTFTATPGNAARKIFNDICVTGILNVHDVIPFINTGTFMPEDTIPEPSTSVTYSLEPTTVYSAIKTICDANTLGFRILRQDATADLWFDVYSGSDRTRKQSTLPAVVFSSDLENLQSGKRIETVDAYKNCAYVFSPVDSVVVYADNVVPDTDGFERRVLLVRADDITADTPSYNSALTARGREELSKHKALTAFDGEVLPNSQYRYGTDYNLGDLVEVQNEDGEVSDMRVTEQIFVCDEQGERQYPTLSIQAFITTGTWLSWPNNQVWSDLTDETWAEM